MSLARRIALVEADESLLAAITSFLEVMNYEVVAFASAEAFLSLADIPNLGFILIEIDLPGMKGLELLNTLRSAHPKVKILVMTGSRDGISEQRALARGADRILQKPFLADELIQCLEDT